MNTEHPSPSSAVACADEGQFVRSGAAAFGDGSHPTTLGMLAALETLSHWQGHRIILDMGCGSGILAAQAAYQWHVPVVAADISATAIEATRQTAATRGLADLITAVQSDGFHHPFIAARAPYDMILCNLLAEPLVAMAHDLVSHLADEGIAVLSGLLRWQSAAIEDIYGTLGLRLLQRLTVADWITLIFQKDNGA